MNRFALPDLGEGLQDARIVEWHVEPSQVVSEGDDLVSVETAKAIVDIPSPFSGRVKQLAAKTGATVKVGELLLTIDETNTASTHTDTQDQREPAPEVHRSDLGIVGSIAESAPSSGGTRSTVEAVDKSHAYHDASEAIKALPSVRKKAQDLGIELSAIKGTGPSGSITFADLETHKHSAGDSAHTDTPIQSNNTTNSQSSISQSVRQRMSQFMQQSASRVVRATVNEIADIDKQSVDVDLSVLTLQAMVYATLQEPALNAWFDEKSISLQTKTSVNAAIAVDTATGLLTPVIKDIDKMNSKGIREAMNALIQRCRAGKATPDELNGATMTLSNFGSIGGMHASLIIPTPTVAIVGIGRARDLVVSVDGSIAVHRCLPVSLSFDHRAITGGEATRFLNALIAFLEDPTIDCSSEDNHD